jgi:membrane-associated phospholipid phosphatase
MPPLYQDPLSAVPGAWRWTDLARSLVEVACEPWAVALIALAVFSWLEAEVKGVLKVFLPLALALLAAGGVAVLARAVGGTPRPVGGTGHALAATLRRAFPSGQAAAVATFAVYAALAYGRRALPAVVPAALAGAAHVLAGPHWAAEAAGGGTLGIAAGAVAYALALRLAPGGHLSRLRGRGGAPERPPGPGSP